MCRRTNCSAFGESKATESQSLSNISYAVVHLLVHPFVYRAFLIRDRAKSNKRDVLFSTKALRAVQLFLGQPSAAIGEQLRVGPFGKLLMQNLVLRTGETFELKVNLEMLTLRATQIFGIGSDISQTKDSKVDRNYSIQNGIMLNVLNSRIGVVLKVKSEEKKAKYENNYTEMMLSPFLSVMSKKSSMVLHSFEDNTENSYEAYDFIEDRNGWRLLKKLLSIYSLQSCVRGIVLLGPPNVGKTLCARHIAAVLSAMNESDVQQLKWNNGQLELSKNTFLSANNAVYTLHCSMPLLLSDELEKTHCRIVKLFSTAQRMRPSLFVFDDTEYLTTLNVGSSKDDITYPPSARLFMAMLSSFLGAEEQSVVHRSAPISVLWIARDHHHVPRSLCSPYMLSFCIQLESGSLASNYRFLQHLGFLHEASWIVDETTLIKSCENTKSSLVTSYTNAWNRSELARLLSYDTATDAIRYARNYVPANLRQIAHACVLNKDNHMSIKSQVYVDYSGAWSRIQEIILFPLSRTSIRSDTKVEVPKGVLLYGPSGVGKTALLSSVAATLTHHLEHGKDEASFAQSHFFAVNTIVVDATSLISKYVGESEKNLQNLFRAATALSPCVLLIDHFERIASRRGTGGSETTDRMLTTFLLSMNEAACSSLVVIAATDRKEGLDPAALRAGRFDVHIEISFPNPREKLSIAEGLLRYIPCEMLQTDLRDFLIAAMAKTNLKTPSDISHAIHDACWRAIERGSHELMHLDLEIAFAR